MTVKDMIAYLDRLGIHAERKAVYDDLARGIATLQKRLPQQGGERLQLGQQRVGLSRLHHHLQGQRLQGDGLLRRLPWPGP